MEFTTTEPTISTVPPRQVAWARNVLFLQGAIALVVLPIVLVIQLAVNAIAREATSTGTVEVVLLIVLLGIVPLWLGASLGKRSYWLPTAVTITEYTAFAGLGMALVSGPNSNLMGAFLTVATVAIFPVSVITFILSRPARAYFGSGFLVPASIGGRPRTSIEPALQSAHVLVAEGAIRSSQPPSGSVPVSVVVARVLLITQSLGMLVVAAIVWLAFLGIGLVALVFGSPPPGAVTSVWLGGTVVAIALVVVPIALTGLSFMRRSFVPYVLAGIEGAALVASLIAFISEPNAGTHTNTTDWVLTVTLFGSAVGIVLGLLNPRARSWFRRSRTQVEASRR